MRAGLRRLSPESAYARFFASKTHLTDEELRYLTEIDQEHHFALGALADDGGGGGDGDEPVGLGVARFIRLPDTRATAEAAITVADELHGRGLGKLLFMRLCAAAAERGIERLRCDVLGSNTAMQHLLERVAPDRTVEVGGGVVSIELAVPAVSPAEPPTSPAPAGAAYRLLRAAAAETGLTKT